MNKKLNVILILIIIFLIGFIIYDKSFKNNETNNNIEENDSNYKNSLNVYKYENDTLCLESEHCNNIAFTIKTETSNAKVIAFDDLNKLVLYYDNTYKIYKVNEKTSIETKLKLSDYSFINLIDENYISLRNNEKVNLINVSNNQIELSENISTMGANDYYVYYSYSGKKLYIMYDVITESKSIMKIYDNDRNIIYEGSLPFEIYVPEISE